MNKSPLPQLLASLHEDIEWKLKTARKTQVHPTNKGDASENVWLEMLRNYLPKRYQVEKAQVIDSRNKISDQIDVVVFDRQYSPFILHYQGQIVIPAESVYAVFEAKQAINANQVAYAQKKVASVRRLHRTSLPIPHAGGTYPAKSPFPILGGILTLESDWSPAFGQPLSDALDHGDALGRLDIGCVAAHGYFSHDRKLKTYEMILGGKSATAFLFKLISELQFSGTVPMINVQAYAQWLAK